MKNKIIKILKKYTKHEHVFLTQRGNKSILTALRIAKVVNPKKYILIQDQGGWITYLQYPKKLKFEIKKLKTDYGVINLKELKNNIKDASALLLEDPAGYFAQQPLKEIYDICRKKCIVILDSSGSIGIDNNIGLYSDIIISSFGKWKPINLEYGGFISFSNRKFLINNILDDLDFDKSRYDDLFLELKNVKKRYEKFGKINDKIKDDLKNYDIIHKNKNGINVIIKFNNEEEMKNIINFCEKNKYEFLICPRYNRVNEKAISIEVKRL